MWSSRFSRRALSERLAGLGLHGLSLATLWQALSQGEAAQAQMATPSADPGKASCPSVSSGDIIDANNAITVNDGDCLYWTDSLYFLTSSLAASSRIAFLLRVPQSDNNYVDKVVLANNARKPLAVRYLAASDKISGGYPPYLIFDGVDLRDSNASFYLLFQRRRGEETKIYQQTLIFRRSLRGLHNPELLAGLANALTQSPHEGVVTSPFLVRARASTFDAPPVVPPPASPGPSGPAAPAAPKAPAGPGRAELNELQGDNFTVRVSLDADDAWRYILVTDPVGRLLGLADKSEYNKPGGDKKRVEVTALTEAQKVRYNLLSVNIAKIKDCPYVMVFIDDGQSYTKSTIWLR